MFDSSFPFSLIQKTPKKSDYQIAEYIFQFRTSKRRYVVIVEEYELDVFAIKFFPAHKKNQPNRYSLILNDFDFPPIIRTCINIMQSFLVENLLASFAYVGANSITNSFTESKANTKRYRIYEYVMDAFLNPEIFKRFFSTKNSAVLLVNNKNTDYDSHADKIIVMFTDLYNELDDIDEI